LLAISCRKDRKDLTIPNVKLEEKLIKLQAGYYKQLYKFRRLIGIRGGILIPVDFCF